MKSLDSLFMLFIITPGAGPLDYFCYLHRADYIKCIHIIKTSKISKINLSGCHLTLELIFLNPCPKCLWVKNQSLHKGQRDSKSDKEIERMREHWSKWYTDDKCVFVWFFVLFSYIKKKYKARKGKKIKGEKLHGLSAAQNEDQELTFDPATFWLNGQNLG